MNKYYFQITFATVLLWVSIGSAFAQSGFIAQPWVYDPGHTGVSAAAWIPGTGAPDAGNSDHGLYLQKFATTPTNAAAGASIKGVNGITLSTLGFDVRNDGHCGAGAPRYNVTLVGGDSFYFFFGCSYGVHTPVLGYPNWTRVRFTDADAFAANGGTWPGFGNAQIAAIDLVFD